MDTAAPLCYDAGMRTQHLLPYVVIVIATTAAVEANVPAGLPVFKHHSIVLDYKNLKYNPCNDVIIPSVIRTEHLDKPLGKYYLYYAPHNAPGGICLAYASLHISEVDAAFEQTKHLGVFYDRTSFSPDNVAQMSPCLVAEGSQLYLFTNVGPRLNQKIALAIADIPADK